MEKEKLGDSIFFSEKQLNRDRTDLCELCRKNVTRKQQGIKCDTEDCSRWFHYGCVELNDAIVPEGNWYCPYCSNEGILKENVDKNIFDKDNVLLAEKKEKEEIETFVDSLPLYCEHCHLLFETNDEFNIHNDFVHKATDGGKKKKKKSQKNKVVSRKNDSRSKKNNGKKNKSLRRRSAAGGKKKKKKN